MDTRWKMEIYLQGGTQINLEMNEEQAENFFNLMDDETVDYINLDIIDKGKISVNKSQIIFHVLRKIE